MGFARGAVLKKNSFFSVCVSFSLSFLIPLSHPRWKKERERKDCLHQCVTVKKAPGEKIFEKKGSAGFFFIFFSISIFVFVFSSKKLPLT